MKNPKLLTPFISLIWIILILGFSWKTILIYNELTNQLPKVNLLDLNANQKAYSTKTMQNRKYSISQALITVDGEILFRLSHNIFVKKDVKWYKDGKFIFIEKDIDALVRLVNIDAHPLIFWEDKVTYRKNTNFVLVFMVVLLVILLLVLRFVTVRFLAPIRWNTHN